MTQVQFPDSARKASAPADASFGVFDFAPSISRRNFLWMTSLSAAGLAVGCAQNPVTGESQLMLISVQDEIKIDRQYSPQQFSSDYGVVRDQRLNAYLSGVGRKEAALSHRRRMPYNFQVVNANYVNAYAFPGGSIAATRGILLKLDNEAELAALLGHELGHVNARHSAFRMSKSQLSSVGVGLLSIAAGARLGESAGKITAALGQLGAGALLASYSRDNERQADALGNEYMVRAGYSTLGMVGLMEMLNSMHHGKPGYADLLFATHPMSDERLSSARSAASGAYAASRKLPLHRDRYMDNIAGVRRIKGAIEEMQKAESLLNRNNADQAAVHLKRALKTAPDDYAGLAMMAKCQLVRKDFTAAGRYAEKAKRAYPGEAQALHLNGFSLMKQKRYDRALADFQQANRVLPGNPGPVFFEGYCQENLNRRQDAARKYHTYLKAVSEGEYARHAYERLVKWGYIKQ